jgi:hypothetical protein
MRVLGGNPNNFTGNTTVDASATFTRGGNVFIKVGGDIEVRAGVPMAAASDFVGDIVTATANASLTAGLAVTLDAAGTILIAGGSGGFSNHIKASASYVGATANANANANVGAGTSLTLTATGLTVRGGTYANANAAYSGTNVATVNANATLTAQTFMMLSVSGPVLIAGADNAVASAYGFSREEHSAKCLGTRPCMLVAT